MTFLAVSRELLLLIDEFSLSDILQCEIFKLQKKNMHRIFKGLLPDYTLSEKMANPIPVANEKNEFFFLNTFQ